MPIGNTYDSRPGGIQGDEKLITFTINDTYNQTIDEIGVFILNQLDPEVVIQDTAPDPMVASSLWVDSTTLDMYAAYDDGEDTQYLQIVSQNNPVIEWGTIIGTLADQTDLQNTLNSLQDTIDDTIYSFGIALAQLDTDIAVVAGVAKFPFPENATLTEVFVRLATAPTGANAIFDINVSASSILTNKIVIEAGEYSSLDATTQPSFSDAVVDKGEAVTVDCDQIGATVAGQNPVLIINYKKR